MSEITLEVLSGSKIRLQDMQDINRLSLELRPGIKFVTLGEAQAVKRNHHLFVARSKEKRIVGMATLIEYLEEGNRVGRIEDEIVTGSFRDRGIGKQLAELLITTARQLKLKRLFILNKPEGDVAQTLFFDLGFEPSDLGFEPRRRDPNVLRLDL